MINSSPLKIPTLEIWAAIVTDSISSGPPSRRATWLNCAVSHALHSGVTPSATTSGRTYVRTDTGRNTARTLGYMRSGSTISSLALAMDPYPE